MSRSSSAPAAYGNKSTADIEAELRSHFAVQHHKFVFGELLGRGAFGLAFSIIEKLSHNRTRRLVVKRSLKPRGEDDLRNEIEWLKTLRGAEHVVRLLASHDEPHPTTACVGLAYPPNGGEDDPNQLETIPGDGTQPRRTEHADLSAANSTAGGGFQEHDVIPPLKFIDFGRTREGFKGIPDNIRGILRIMVNLIARKEVRISAWITEYQGFETRATEFLHHGNGANYPTLDDEIRDFLARCLAWEESDRMSLQDMLRIAENAVRTKTAAAYPDATGETDEAIRELVQQFIYNADT
ncbi:hypothetical protein Daesc_001116 [Daldinia eschscholtzii]|uniref:Protein kinase domain-containing protein n=1 Tax=Daldinia eschscholtzii TaxID=292717 RepID=A0AAX6N098_9PEZI